MSNAMRAAAAAAAAVLGLVGCTSSTNGGGTTASTGASGGGGLSQRQAQHALLTTAQVGTGFAQSTPTDQSSPPPCEPNSPPLDQVYKPSVKVRTEFARSDGNAAVTEEILAYPDVATATKALAAGEKGLACRTTTVGTGSQAVKIAISAPTDLTASVGTTVDKCEGWSVTTTALKSTLIVARLGQHLVVLSFTTASKVDTSTLPDSKTITEAALAKVRSAI